MIKVKTGDWVLIDNPSWGKPIFNSRVARVCKIVENAIISDQQPPNDLIVLNTDLSKDGCCIDWIERKLTKAEIEQYKAFCVEARDLTIRIQDFFGGEVKFVDPKEFEVNHE